MSVVFITLGAQYSQINLNSDDHDHCIADPAAELIDFAKRKYVFPQLRGQKVGDKEFANVTTHNILCENSLRLNISGINQSKLTRKKPKWYFKLKR